MKLALTGGPSGGKTTLALAIQKEFARHVLVVPEAASMLFGGGWPRRKDSSLVSYQQRAIYYLQRELEGLLLEEHHNLLLVCDRGSLDGIAYWPTRDPIDFLASVGSALPAELARYDWVIHLDTAPADGYDRSNPLRNESWEEAWRLNELVKNAWSGHPRRFLIANNGHDFFGKMKRALGIVEQIVSGRTYDQIQASLSIEDWMSASEES
jgi:nicotinamide riboside kinase